MKGKEANDGCIVMKVTTEGNPTSFSWEIWSQIKCILAQSYPGKER